MRLLDHVLAFFGVHMRPDTIQRSIALPAEVTHDVGEVYDERSVYSALKYVHHMRAWMNRADITDPKELDALTKEKAAFSRFIKRMEYYEPDAYQAYFFEVDGYIEAGELVHVLTEEEHAEKRKRILDNIEYWRAEANTIGKDYGIDPAAMHRVLNGEEVPPEELLTVDDEEVDVWAEDEET